MGTIWRDLEESAPEIARSGRERLAEDGVALLGTLRKDGSPRISPVEPYFVRGHLVFGAMAWSTKAHDLVRDPRCVLHSAVSDPDATGGELKLYGRAGEIRDREIREGAPKAWWVGRPVEDARVFSMTIEQAAFLTWDPEGGLVIMRRWSPERGLSEVERPYP